MNVSDFPFTREATEKVRLDGPKLADLLKGRAFLSVRKRAAERVIGAIKGEISSEVSSSGISSTDVIQMVELLSYPISRILVSCIDDDLLTRRYAMAEAKLANKRIRSIGPGELTSLAVDLGISPTYKNDLFSLHFTDYISSASRLRSPKWKLVNRPLVAGYVFVTLEEMARLLEERVRDRISKGLPMSIEAPICEALLEYITPIKAGLAEFKSADVVDMGTVNAEAFPPCIKSMLSQVSTGTNLPHSARFALTSFLLNVGMSPEEVINLFNTSPDFDLERTRYQVEHIAGSSGTAYKSPSCATMATYGNCPGEDQLCRHVRHPLGYYRRKLREKAT